MSYDAALLAVTVRAFSIYSFSFLLCGYNIYASSFFTALNNGLISAVISFSRVFAFQIPAILLLPLLWKLNGIWMSLVVADLLASIFGTVFILVKRKKYQY